MVRIEQPEWYRGELSEAIQILRPYGILIPGTVSFRSLWMLDTETPQEWNDGVELLTSGLRAKVQGALQPMALHKYHISEVRQHEFAWLFRINGISNLRAEFIWKTFVP